MSGKGKSLSIKVGSKDYEVIYKSPILVKGVQVWGYIDVSQCKISIDNTNCDQIQFNSLIHEIVHGCLYEIGNDLFNNEPFVESLSNIIVQVIKDNRDCLD